MFTPKTLDRREIEKTVLRRGLMLIISSPSGTGKTTLSGLLCERDQGVDMSVSVTTRLPRPGEINGVHYDFVDEATFKDLRHRGNLLEWANVFGHLYGTPGLSIDTALKGGRDVLFDIDWQGAKQLYDKKPCDTVRVFLLPPSSEALRQRLRGRGQDSEETVTTRMAHAAAEISHWSEYDYVIINNNLEESFMELQLILSAERLKRERRMGLTSFVQRIQEELFI
ncbi:MAG: guanylate kinase [Alphaproteobacteria bacterium]|nr:guanylate kinase [Alphaproteobacteria bacterium]